MEREKTAMTAGKNLVMMMNGRGGTQRVMAMTMAKWTMVGMTQDGIVQNGTPQSQNQNQRQATLLVKRTQVAMDGTMLIWINGIVKIGHPLNKEQKEIKIWLPTMSQKDTACIILQQKIFNLFKLQIHLYAINVFTIEF